LSRIPRVFGFRHAPTAIFNSDIPCDHAVIKKANRGKKATATAATTTTTERAVAVFTDCSFD